MTYHIVVIDDMRSPVRSESNQIVTFLLKTPEEGLQVVKEFHASGVVIEELWLDHDMGIDPDTGQDLNIMPIVEYLEEHAFQDDPVAVDHIFIHTSNPYAGEQMMRALSRHYPHVSRAELPVEERAQR